MPKISELPLANKLKEEDYIPIVQDGVTKKVKGTHFVTEEEYSLDAFSPTIAANDKAMYKFGEGDNVDFSESAYDGAYKSAILKGNTLVNHLNISFPLVSWGDNAANSYSRINFENTNVLLDTDYLLVVESCSTVTSMISLTNVFTTGTIDLSKSKAHKVRTKSTSIGKQPIHFRSTSGGALTDEEKSSIRMMLIPYQDGMENWDIPYFEGMKSVRMPVLRTIGKNLFSNEFDLHGSTANQLTKYENGFKSTGYIDSIQAPYQIYQVKPNTQYTISLDVPTGNGYLKIKDDYSDKSLVLWYGGNANETSYKKTFTTLSDKIRIDLLGHKSTIGNVVELINIQLEEGSTATTFEDHKSNILSIPEDLELRGVGKVKDELNVATGELTQRIGEVVFDGITNSNVPLRYAGEWSTETVSTFQFTLSNSVPLIPTRIITNCKMVELENEDLGMVIGRGEKGTIFIKVAKSIATIDDFNRYLKTNNISFAYLLETPTIKTVDLSGTPFGYKGGHIIKSSAEGSLLPKFEYEVAVSRGAQISQNTSTLIKHDEKITELLKKTAATYINQKAEIAHLLNMSNTLEEAQTIPFIEDDYVNDDCMVDSDMVMDDMELEPEKEIIDNVDTLLINLIYDLIELNDTLDLSEKVELFRQSGLIDKHNYEIIKEKLNPSFKEEDYADINQ